MTFNNAVLAGVLLVAVQAGARAQSPDFRAEAAQIVTADADFVTTFHGGTPNDFRGRDTVLEEWGAFFDPNGPSLTSVPIKGEVIGAGDVGYTVGRSVLRGKAPDGTMRERLGQYLTVWRKQTDGTWKVVFDTGSTLPQ